MDRDDGLQGVHVGTVYPVRGFVAVICDCVDDLRLQVATVVCDAISTDVRTRVRTRVGPASDPTSSAVTPSAGSPSQPKTQTSTTTRHTRLAHRDNRNVV